MRIKSVKLDNFKSHKNSYLSFSPGLNLIIGPNGSGKSSILQAIGFAFFGITNRMNLSQFITNDSNSDRSTIKIEFEGDDGVSYTLNREISTRGQKVSLVDDKGIIVEKVEKVNEKIRQIFQINSDNPEEIYKNVITAYQNDITDIFARTPAKRNEFFNALFNVEIYKLISSTHVKNYIDKLQKDLSDLNVKAQYLESEVEREKALDEIILDVKNKIGEVQKEIEELEKQRFNMNDFIDDQTRIGDKIKTLSSEKKMYGIKIENLQKQLEKLLKDAEEARSASLMLENYLKDYNCYNEISEKIKKTNDEIFKIVGSLNEIQNIKDRISAKKEEREKIIATIESDRKRIAENQKAIESQSQDMVNYSKNANSLKSDLERERESHESIMEKIKKIKAHMEKKDYLAISNFFNSKDKETFEMLSDKIEDKDALRNLVDRQNEAIAEVNSKIKELIKAKSALSNGICPYLKEKCLNIKGDSASYFDPLIKELNDELTNFKKEKSEIDERIKKSAEMESERSKFIEKLIDELNQEKMEAYQKLTKIESEIDFQMKQVETIQKRKVELALANDDLNKDISKMLGKIDLMNKEIDELSSKITKENELKQRLNFLQEEITKDQAEMQKVKDGYELYNQNKASASKLEGINEEIEIVKNQKRDIDFKIEEISDEIEKLKSAYREDDLQRAKSDLIQINEKMGSFRQKLGELNGSLSEKLKIKTEIEEKKSQLEKIKNVLSETSKKISFAHDLRDLLDDMGSKVSSTYRDLISSKAMDKYNMMTKRSDIVKWSQDYELHLLSYAGNVLVDRDFEMLSGGEQISLALAMRMAMASFFWRSGFAIFDEPTVNLDADRRSALSESLPELLEGMDQVIIVTHDDTFKEMTEKIIMLKNIDGFTIVEN